MADRLMQLGQTSIGGAVLRSLGVVAPTPLKREIGPWNQAQGLQYRVVSSSKGRLGLQDSPSDENLLVDATGITDLDELSALSEAVRGVFGSIKRNGKVLFVNDLLTANDNAQTVAVQRAVSGWVRSLAKEVGPKSITVNLLSIGTGIDGSCIDVPIGYFLSGRSAFVTGQNVSFNGPSYRSDLKQGPLVCLVTGGCGGIGAATVRRLAAEGHKVVIVDVPAAAERGQALAAQIPNSSFHAADITDRSHIELLADSILKEHGRLDVLVNNAGITRDRTYAKMKRAEWDTVLNVNLRAAMELTEAFADTDLMHSNGRVINIASISGLAGNFGQTNYTASKAGLIGYSMAKDAGLSAKGIRVNAIAPGFIETDMVATMPMFTREAARRLSALRQGGHPTDVAEAVAFLAHPHNDRIGGQVLRVCGGNFLGA